MEITGDSPYTEEEIRRVSGVEQGDNLFTLNKYQISSRIYTQLPYIGTVNLSGNTPIPCHPRDGQRSGGVD